MQHYVYSFLLICFFTICAGRLSSSWRSCCSFQIGHVRPLSTLRLLWQTRCGCSDHWCHSVPLLPRMQRVALLVQALHSLAEIWILAGGLCQRTVASFGSVCFFDCLSFMYHCAQHRLECNAFAGNTLHTNSGLVWRVGGGWRRHRTNGKRRMQPHLIRRMFVEDRMATANAARRAGDAHKPYELIYIYSSNNNNKNYSY